jgi:hypothetical protein
MSNAPDYEPTPDEEQSVGPIEPADWVKPVELIELLQRRAEKRRQSQSPTASPFYDAQFVANHPTKKKRKSD